ncbi:hypothetical protein [Zobellia laminariae]|uniref:hypothetical protein n=1 Tax=Zobellia laminariae TaxID=248906 RepID=UPI0034CFAF1A
MVVIFKGPVDKVPNFTPPQIFNNMGILFLISLMGWMPTTVEASSWVSLWSVEKWKTQSKPSLRESLQEFKVGYFTTSLLALFFLTIGCMTLYGTNTALSGNAVTFADQIVQLFTTHIGPWAYILIAIAAFATMFSTCMTAHDALARVSIDITGLLFSDLKLSGNKQIFAVSVLLLACINFTVVSVFKSNMGQLVALATFVSFVVAPIVGYMNLKNVMSEEIPIAYRPKKPLQILTYLGILFLSLFSIYYFWIVIFE